MRNTILFTICFFLFIAGCNNQINDNVVAEQQELEIIQPSCPSPCNDFKQCTKDICNEQTQFKCEHQIIENCCGNSICEPNETYSECALDCEPTKEECLIETDEDNLFQYFKYSSSACKNIQILNCSNAHIRDKAHCFTALAEDYKDGDMCDFIEIDYELLDIVVSQMKSYYWLCKAMFAYGKSACSYVEDEYFLELCLKYT